MSNRRISTNSSRRLQKCDPLLPKGYSLATSCRHLKAFRGKVTGTSGKTVNRLLTTINVPFRRLFIHRSYPLKADERKKA